MLDLDFLAHRGVSLETGSLDLKAAEAKGRPEPFILRETLLAAEVSLEEMLELECGQLELLVLAGLTLIW